MFPGISCLLTEMRKNVWEQIKISSRTCFWIYFDDTSMREYDTNKAPKTRRGVVGLNTDESLISQSCFCVMLLLPASSIYQTHRTSIGPRYPRQMGTKVPIHSENTCSRGHVVFRLHPWSRSSTSSYVRVRRIDKYILPSRSRSAPHEAKPIQSP